MLSDQDLILAALRDAGLLDDDAAERARRHAAEHRTTVPDATLALGLVAPRDLALVRAAACEFPFVDLDHFDIDLNHAALLPRSVAQKHAAFVLFNLGPSVTVGMADPLDLAGVDRLRAILRADLEPVLCEPAALRALIERAYSLTAMPAGEAAAPEDVPADDAPIVAALNQLLAQAIDEGASDIHLGPDEREPHIRFRIDGSLRARQGPPLSSHPALIQRLKVMANLDLTQTRRPQDGKFRFPHAVRARSRWS